MTAALTLASASPVSGANDGQIIGKNQITLTGDRLTPEALWAMGRIGTFAVSPDAQKIVYTVSYYSVQQNKSHTVLYLMDADGANPTLLTTTADNESEPAFTPDGQRITFLSGKSGSSQIWEMALDGTSRRQVSFCHKDVEGYKFSPDGKKVIIVHSVDTYTSIEKKYDDLPLSSGMVITDLNYKHWDRYVTTIPHIFVADVQDGRTGDGIDLLNGEPFECPMLPFGGSEQFNWSPDSRYIVYTSRKKTGRDYAISTDSDIYRYDTATGQTENLCKPSDYKEPEIDPSRSMEHQIINHLDRDCNVGYDTNPAYSPDGKYVAWLSMARNGYESDRTRLCVLDLKTGAKTYVTEAFQSGVNGFCWAADSRSFYFTGVWQARSMVHSTNLKGEVRPLTTGDFDYGAGLALCGKNLIVTRHSISAPDDIYSLSFKKKKNAEVRQLTRENQYFQERLKMGEVKERWVATTDGKKELCWVVYPPHFDPSKKYPVIEYIYAGPHDSFVPKSFTVSPVDAALAQLGFIVVQIDGMGTANRSKKFHDVCWKNLKDGGFPDRIAWMKAAAAKYPEMDIDRVGIYGCSAGGQNAMGAVLFHPDFYKVSVAACGCHDNRMDKIWWNEQWMGYPVGKEYEACSNTVNAYRLQGKLMLILGELDDNVDPSTTFQVVNALIGAGKEFEFVVLPNQRHTMGGAYGERKRRDFFIRHLQGLQTPDWNKEEKK